MISPEENRNTDSTLYQNAEPAPRPRRKIGRTLLAILLIAAAAYGVKIYMDDREAATSQAAVTPQRTPATPVVLQTLQLADLAAGHEYVGRVEAIQSVQLRPQVPGQIAGVHFKEGSMVKAGQVLFTLDSKQYQATVDLRKADLSRAEATYSQAVKYYDRLKTADKRSVSASDIDIAQSNVLQGKAGVEQAKASLKLAQIDLEYTKIAAPISGRIGKAEFTKGNYVTPASGVLATIVQTNPIRVSFALPDRDYLDAIEEFSVSDKSVYNATIRLSNGEEYPLSGTRDFEENAMDRQTGTMTIRLRFKNDEGLLVPGSMVRVATKPVKKHVAVVIPQTAIMTDSQGDYAYVVDDRNIAHQRRIVLGAEAGTLREVLSGLEAGEKIILYGLQSVRPESEVAPMAATNGSAPRSPAEQAMESASDVKILPAASGDASADSGSETAERKN